MKRGTITLGCDCACTVNGSNVVFLCTENCRVVVSPSFVDPNAHYIIDSWGRSTLTLLLVIYLGYDLYVLRVPVHTVY